MNQLLSRIAGGALVAAVVSAPIGDPAVEPPPQPHAPSATSTESLQEQPLDTDVTPEPPKPAPTQVTPPKPLTPPPPKKKKEHRFRRVRTPRDEDLPAWVPISGRLTVVESCDLAENLGLAPMGTALDGGCPSVAELLEKERLEPSRAPISACPAGTR